MLAEHVERFAGERAERVLEGLLVRAEGLDGSDRVEHCCAGVGVDHDGVGNKRVAESPHDGVADVVVVFELSGVQLAAADQDAAHDGRERTVERETRESLNDRVMCGAKRFTGEGLGIACLEIAELDGYQPVGQKRGARQSGLQPVPAVRTGRNEHARRRVTPPDTGDHVGDVVALVSVIDKYYQRPGVRQEFEVDSLDRDAARQDPDLGRAVGRGFSNGPEQPGFPNSTAADNCLECSGRSVQRGGQPGNVVGAAYQRPVVGEDLSLRM
ncbi:MAG: hypothetical protein M3O32_01615 [Actinomycetota bacterium]|nr:hypothetical protein [Actinomycetota bacterium]